MKIEKILVGLAFIGVLFNACSHPSPQRNPSSLNDAEFKFDEDTLLNGNALNATDEATPVPGTSADAPEEDPWVRLAQSEIDPDARRSCAISALMISYLDESDEKELGQNARIQIEELKKLYGKHPTRLQKQILRDLERIERHEAGKDDFRKAFSALCKVGRAVGGTFIRTSALAASAVTSALTMPIRFTFKLGIGTFTRKLTPERGPGYADLLGTRGLSNWSGPLYQTIRVAFFSGNPLLLGIYGLTSIDLQVQTLCRSTAIRKSDREEKFCKNYEAIKKGEFVVTEVGEKFGVKIGKFLLHTLDFREDGIANPKICEKSPKRQVKVAYKARERLIDELIKSGYKPMSVLTQLGENTTAREFQSGVVPAEVGGCVKILVRFRNKADRESYDLKSEGFVDGISITTQSEEEVVADEAAKKKAADAAKREALARGETPSPSPAPDRSDEKLCKDAFIGRGVAIIQKKENRHIKGQLLQTAINPVRFATLDLREVLMPQDKLRLEPASSRGTGKNVVFILAPNEAQKKEYAELADKMKQARESYKVEVKKLKALMKEKSFEACLAKQEEIGFNWKTFDDLQESSKSFAFTKFVSDYAIILKEAKKAGKKLFVLKSNRMKWEIRDFTDISQFREVATQDDIRNLVFVSHGEITGKIIDSRINLLPASAFGWLSPSIQSISLFSCHSKELLRIEADKQLQSQESYFPVRYLGIVNANEIFEAQNQAPSTALSEFLEDLDRELYRAERGNERTQSVQHLIGKRWPEYQKPAECLFSFPGTRVLKGAASLKVRSGDGKAVYWIGMIYPETQDGVWFKSRCDWLLDGKNEIFIENGSPREKISFEKPEFNMLLRDADGKTLAESQTELFYRSGDCSIKGTRFEFNKLSDGSIVTAPQMDQAPCVPKPSREASEPRQ